MYFNEHNPPHFHVEWAEDHQAELLQNWENIRMTDEYHKIDPLV